MTSYSDTLSKLDLPSEKEAEELREVFQERTTFLDKNLRTPWKGRVVATVDPNEVDEVRMAMNFMGAIVDNEKRLSNGNVKLFSRGYYHHIGA